MRRPSQRTFTRLRCAAQRKHGLGPCKAWAIIGRQHCRMHGGTQPMGHESPNYRGRGYSQHLPTALADRYLATLHDPALLAIDTDVALITLRMEELAANLDTSDMGHLWDEAHAAWQAMETAQAAGDIPTMRERYAAIGALIQRGANNRYLWSDLIQTAKDLAQLRLAEHKRVTDLQAVMTGDQMLLVLGLIQNAVREAVLARVEAQTAREIFVDVQGRVGKLGLVPKREAS